MAVTPAVAPASVPAPAQPERKEDAVEEASTSEQPVDSILATSKEARKVARLLACARTAASADASRSHRGPSAQKRAKGIQWKENEVREIEKIIILAPQYEPEDEEESVNEDKDQDDEDEVSALR